MPNSTMTSCAAGIFSAAGDIVSDAAVIEAFTCGASAVQLGSGGQTQSIRYLDGETAEVLEAAPEFLTSALISAVKSAFLG